MLAGHNSSGSTIGRAAGGLSWQVIHTAVGSVALQGIAFVSTIILARGLGPQQLGNFQFVVSAAVFVTLIGTAGLDEAIAYLLPRYRVKQPEKGRSLVRYILLLTTGISLIAGALFFVGAGPLAKVLGIAGLAQHLRWLVLLCPVLMLLSISLAILRSLEHASARAFIYYYLVSLLFVAGLLLLWRHGLTPDTAYIARTGSMAAGAAVALFLVTKYAGAGSARVTLADLRAAHSLAGWVVFAGMFQYLVEQPLVDLALVGHYDAPAMLGLYSVAAKVAGLIGAVMLALNVVAAPVFARAAAAGKRDELTATYRFCRVVSAVSAVSIGLLVVIAHWPVLAWFGPQYTGAARIVEIFAAAQIVAGLAGINAPVLIACGYAAVEFSLSAGAAVVLVIVGIILGRSYGAIGVAFASATSIVVLAFARKVAVGRLAFREQTATG